MPYDPSLDHGMADYNSWVSLPDGFNISQGTESVSRADRKYASLVVIAGQSTSPTTAVSSLVASFSPAIASNMVTIGNYTYIGEADPGTPLSAPNWRCQQLYRNGNVGSVTWANGNGNFSNTADNLSALVYF